MNAGVSKSSLYPDLPGDPELAFKGSDEIG